LFCLFFRLLALLAQGGVLDLVSSVLAGPLFAYVVVCYTLVEP